MPKKRVTDSSRSIKELRGVRRRRLTERLRILRERARVLEVELDNYTSGYYRVCIFGSARVKPEDSIYQSTFRLAEGLGELGIDILTGGGPGLMEAANKGFISGKQKSGSRSRSYGLTIDLNLMAEYPNEHLDIKQHHRRFSSRLDDFMRLSNAVIVEPGGIGTLLELVFSWQLIQVGHLPQRPIVLMDPDFWHGFLEWMKEELLERQLISPGDLDFIHLAEKPEDALEIIRSDYQKFLNEGGIPKP